MSNELAAQDAIDSWTAVVPTISMLATQIADTSFVPDAFRGNPAAVTAAILYGREVGLGPMGALQSVNIIKGKPSISAEMMRGLVMQAGHEIDFVDVTNTRAVMRGRRSGSTTWSEASFTMDEAKAMGLTSSNANYRSRPQEMLVARATTRLCRRLFADAIHGLWSVEEAEDYAVEAGTDEPATPGRRTAKRATTARKAASDQRQLEPAQPAPVAAAAAEAPPLPGDEPEPEHAEPAVAALVTTRQLTAIATASGAVGYVERDEKLRLCSALVGRELTTSKELTKQEAAQVLDIITQAQATDDPAGFIDALVNVEQLPVAAQED